MLEKEINLNKKFIIILLFLCVISIGMYSSYAYYEVSVIKNSIIVLKTATIDIVTEVVDKENNTFIIPKNSSITVNVNLTTNLEYEIGYKMYYEVISGISIFNVTSTEDFTNDIVEGKMTTSKTITFTFTNKGSNDIEIKLGTQGGLANYPVNLEQGIELKINAYLGSPTKNATEFKEYVKLQNDVCKTYIEEDGVTYLSGTRDCINFNYVWYSGKLWRITAINEDGTMKMITDDVVTTISYGSDVNFYDITKKNTAYTGSYVYQFLNEDFLDTLYNHENIIVMDSTWNITNSNANGRENVSTKLLETTLINKSTIGKNTPVGLLNSYEFYLSYKNNGSTSDYTQGYLNNGYSCWLLNPYSSSYIWGIYYDGGSYYDSSPNSYGIRPVIVLKSNIEFSDGVGSKEKPYRIKDDMLNAASNITYLNTRSSGEYVIFDEDGDSSTNELYRIVSIEDGKIKLNKNDYIKSGTTPLTKKFSTSTTYGGGTTDDYWDYYLNNTWYNSLANKDMLESSTYYIKQVSLGTSYKNSLCSTNNTTVTTKKCTKTTTTWTGLVGLPRYGEMFASQQGNGNNSSSNIWLITPYSSTDIWYVTNSGVWANGEKSTTNSIYPSITLKSNIVITGGSGTKTNPFTIALKD